MPDPGAPGEPAFDPTVIRRSDSIKPAKDGGDLEGQQLGEYLVGPMLGAGGMGIIYRGEQPQIGKAVAIKVLRPETAVGHESVQALLAEARAVNAIRHPGIVDVFSFGSTPDGRPYIVMELLEGDSLESLLAARVRFTPVEAIDILEQMLSALDAAHGAGVIHRDLKPGNIFVTRLKDGTLRVKLLDFGLAKLTGEAGATAKKTTENVVRGTPQYMAPEQIRAQPVSAQTDLYAVGVIAWELLTGQLPFDAPSTIELLHQHLSAAPQPPSSQADGVTPELDAEVLGLLAKSPEERPATAADVRRALLKLRKTLLDGATVIRARPSAPRATPLSARAPAPTPVAAVPPAAQADTAPHTPIAGARWKVPALVAATLMIIAAVVVVAWPATEQPTGETGGPATGSPAASATTATPTAAPTTATPAATPTAATPTATPTTATPTTATPTAATQTTGAPTTPATAAAPTTPTPRAPATPDSRRPQKPAPTAKELSARVASLEQRLAARGGEATGEALLRRYRLQTTGELDVAGRRSLAEALDRWESTYLPK